VGEEREDRGEGEEEERERRRRRGRRNRGMRENLRIMNKFNWPVHATAKSIEVIE